MSRKRSEEAIEAYRAALRRGRARQRRRRARPRDAIYDKLVGFSGFGFPKSHAAAFALLAYQSAWLRHHYPAEFLCALLNAQPMGFYPPASLVRDAQRRGVEVLPPDVNRERARRARIEGGAVRVGLGYVRSVGEDDARGARRRARAGGPFADVARPRAARAARPARRSRRSSRRAPATRSAAAARAALGARPRRRAPRACPARGGEERQLALPLEPTAETPELPEQTTGSGCSPTTGTRALSVGVHPLELLRPHLPARRALERASSPSVPHGAQRRRRRHGGRAPAAGDRERRRLHAARGRARPDEPDRPAAGLRALPRDRPRRAAAPRARPLRARRPQPRTSLVARARDARPARPPRRRTRPRSRARCRRRTTSATAEDSDPRRAARKINRSRCSGVLRATAGRSQRSARTGATASRCDACEPREREHVDVQPEEARDARRAFEADGATESCRRRTSSPSRALSTNQPSPSGTSPA